MSKNFPRKAIAAVLLSFCLASSAAAKVTTTNHKEACENWANRVTFDYSAHLMGFGSSGFDKPVHEVATDASRIILSALDGSLEQVRKAFPRFYETALVVVVDGLRLGQEMMALNKSLLRECMAIPVK